MDQFLFVPFHCAQVRRIDLCSHDLADNQAVNPEPVDKSVELAESSPDPLPEDAMKDVYWNSGD